jgi:signal transduction histidine kinase
MIALCPEVNQLELVETMTGHKLADLTAPVPKNIGWVAFSTDGATLAASTFDREMQLWDLPRMRQELASLGLDWSSTGADYPTDLAARHSTKSLNATAGSGSALLMGRGTFFLLACCGALLALFTGLYTIRYQQRLVRKYEEVETTVAERNRELKLAQVELLHSQKMKALGTLAAGVAHDFNNLLSVIRMGNQLQGRGDISPEDKSESGRAVERAVEQGKKVVRSMLGYSREPGKGRQTFSVAEMVDEVVLLLNKQFLGGLTLMLELNRDTPPVTAVRGRIEQILLNLIVNAAEAMAGNGRLLISVREVSELSPAGALLLRPVPSAAYVELLVKDSGPGIEANVRDRIFEPFFSTKPQSASSGTGLGLSLVHSLAEQEGLGLSLQTENGTGAAFTVIIPVENARPAENLGIDRPSERQLASD